MKRLVILVLLTLFLFGFSIVTHRGITEKAFEYMPEMMDGFRNQFGSSVVSPLSAYYMLPDLEEPSHSMERIAELTDQYFNALVTNLKNENIEDSEKNIGRIAHMIGDAVSPTQNDSRVWGNIDDYYDFQITDPYFYQMTFTRLDQDGLARIENIYTFTLALCQASVTHVDFLIDVYNQYSDSPETVFQQTKAIFEEQISIGIKALQDVLYTAWIEAGRPDYSDEVEDGGCNIL
ncbi:hypothetical protein JW824_14955 [bacterium]|nr:hypothetical protein [bacterium]